MGSNYYSAQKSELLRKYDEEAVRWQLILIKQYGDDFTNLVLRDSRAAFDALIPHIPYIGGENTFTPSLIGAVQCLALYQTMKALGRTAQETGKILFDAVLRREGEVPEPIPPSQWLTPEQLMERRKYRAKWSRGHRYPEGYVYKFIPGDGIKFDYGYDFTECAAQKFYHAMDADEMMPFFCHLDFAYSSLFGPALTRTMTLADGFPKCDHRFKIGEKGTAFQAKE